MDDESKHEEPMQRTPEGAERERHGLPGEGGTEIPVPDRDAVFGDLEKVAKPRSRSVADDQHHDDDEHGVDRRKGKPSEDLGQSHGSRRRGSPQE